MSSHAHGHAHSPSKAKTHSSPGAESTFDAVRLLSQLRAAGAGSVGLAASGELGGAHHSSAVEQNSARIQIQNQQLKQRVKDLEGIRRLLETQIDALVAENNDLKEINTGYHEQREQLEQEMAEARARSDQTIAALRNKIAMLQRGKRGSVRPGDSQHGEQYGFCEDGADADTRPRNKSVGGFAGPTFSELMRRATPAAEEFTHTLRRQSMTAAVPPGPPKASAVPGNKLSSPAQPPHADRPGDRGSPVHDVAKSKSEDFYEDIFQIKDTSPGLGSLEVLEVTVDRAAHDKPGELLGRSPHTRRVTAPAALPVIDVDLGR